MIKLVQNLAKIRYNVMKKVKQLALIGFSHILHGEFSLKQEYTVVVQIPKWVFQANIVWNATSKGC